MKWILLAAFYQLFSIRIVGAQLRVEGLDSIPLFEQGGFNLGPLDRSWPNIHGSISAVEQLTYTEFSLGSKIKRGALGVLLPVSFSDSREILLRYPIPFEQKDSTWEVDLLVRQVIEKTASRTKNENGTYSSSATTRTYVALGLGAVAVHIRHKDTLGVLAVVTEPARDTSLQKPASLVYAQRPKRIKQKLGPYTYTHAMYGAKGNWEGLEIKLLFNDMDNTAWIFSAEGTLLAVYRFGGKSLRGRQGVYGKKDRAELDAMEDYGPCFWVQPALDDATTSSLIRLAALVKPLATVYHREQ